MNFGGRFKSSAILPGWTETVSIGRTKQHLVNRQAFTHRITFPLVWVEKSKKRYLPLPIWEAFSWNSWASAVFLQRSQLVSTEKEATVQLQLRKMHDCQANRPDLRTILDQWHFFRLRLGADCTTLKGWLQNSLNRSYGSSRQENVLNPLSTLAIN